jgi:nucleoside-diphosphate-sugar epimerase
VADGARVLVTGATGFVGHSVVAALRARGYRVRALVRDPTRVPAAWVGHVEVVQAPGVDAGAALAGAVAGCDIVVHLAGRAHVLREQSVHAAEQAFAATNVEGSRALARAAAAAGVRLIVHASSVGAVTTAAAEPVTDRTVPGPDTAYGRSKLAAEQAVRVAVEGTATAAVSLRPPMMYGPGMRGNPLRLFAHVSRGRPLPCLVWQTAGAPCTWGTSPKRCAPSRAGRGRGYTNT